MLRSDGEKCIVFVNDILNDGLGDLGNLIGIASPSTLKLLSERLPFSISMDDTSSNKETFKPVYLIACVDDSSVLSFVIQSLKHCGIFKALPSSITPDPECHEHLKQLLAHNDHVHIVLYDAKLIHSEANNKTQTYIAKIKQEDINAALDDLDETASPPRFIDKHFIFKSYLNQEMQMLISNFIETHSTLKDQLNNAYAIEWVSTKKFSIPFFDKLPLIQTFLAEHGVSKENTPQCRGMGFSTREHGILLNSPTCINIEDKASTLVQINNKDYLKTLLQQKEDVDLSSRNAKLFLEETLFVPGYIQDKNANTIFIQSIACSPLAGKYKNLAFHVNGKAFVKDALDVDLLREHGIASVEINIANSPPDILPINGAKGNRCLRIFANYWLDDIDYQRLYQSAQIIAGSSGDNSLEHCLSNLLIPFYQVRKWKEKFARDFKVLAASYASGDPAISDFMNSLMKLEQSNTAERVSELSLSISKLITEEFVAKWKVIIENIHKNHNYLAKLPQFIQEGVSFRQLIVATNAKDYSRAAKLLKGLDKDVLKFFVDHALKIDCAETAAFIYFLYPKEVASHLLEDRLEPLELRMEKASFYPSLTDDQLSVAAKIKKRASVDFKTLCLLISEEKYGEAITLLKSSKSKAVCHEIFKAALAHKQYNVASFVYINENIFKGIDIPSSIIEVLRYLKIKNYSNVAEVKSLSFFAPNKNPVDYGAIANNQFIELIRYSIYSYFSNRSDANEKEQINQLYNLCNDTNLTGAEKVLALQAILCQFTWADNKLFLQGIVKSLQKPGTDYLLLKAYFNLSFEEIKPDDYPQQLIALTHNQRGFSGSRFESAYSNSGFK
jgi:hypothetical protein